MSVIPAYCSTPTVLSGLLSYWVSYSVTVPSDTLCFTTVFECWPMKQSKMKTSNNSKCNHFDFSYSCQKLKI